MSERPGLPGGEEPRERPVPRDERDESAESAEELDGRPAEDADARTDGRSELGAAEEMSLDLFPESALSSEEETLRELLRSSVRSIEPPADNLDRTLEHLRRAVPARRAHRRQAMVGGVAAALVAVVGVPALFYGGVVPGVGGDDRPMTAASTHGQTRGPDAGSGGNAGKGEDKQGSGKDEDEGKGDKGGADASPSPSGGPGDSGADPDETLSASAPTCGSDQLGGGSAQSGAPDSSGTVYGSFRVSNVSGDACTVDGEGVVGASVQGSGAGQVVVVDHTPGDPAPGLGDPAAARDEVVLRPGQAYVVKFAYVPNDGCSSPSPQGGRYDGETSGSGAAVGDGSADGGGDGSGGNTGTPGETDGGNGDPGGGEAEVVVSHTPEGGAPVAGTRVPGACGSGTVYRTGVIPQS
ncbi:hypothetical protein ACQEU8_16435 [Streptomyces sp. CA-250714]|uniref:hypothetical protein n=1 Tax=Streptomyces sp. CA-250714 TaxID=3240060 RepID=UPI003D8DA18A